MTITVPADPHSGVAESEEVKWHSAYGLCRLATESLERAASQPRPPERFHSAHVAAMRAAAAVIAVRARASSSQMSSVWELLRRSAPELSEWAAFFHNAARSHSTQGATPGVTSREADDLLRDAVSFVGIVEQMLGISAPGLAGVGQRLVAQ